MKFRAEKSIAKLSGIYAITNIIDERVYIGSAVVLGKRFLNHKSDLVKGKHHSVQLQRFAAKYGLDTLDFWVLEVCEKSELINREQSYLDACVSYENIFGFNAVKIAGSQFGFRHSEATKKIFRARNHRNYKLTKNEVIEIRATYKDLTCKDLAEKFKVGEQCILDIINGRTWRELLSADFEKPQRHITKKLTDQDRSAIKLAYPERTLKSIAEEYGVTITTIHRVVTGC